MWVRKQQYPCQPICLVPKRRQKAICLPSPQIYTYPYQCVHQEQDRRDPPCGVGEVLDFLREQRPAQDLALPVGEPLLEDLVAAQPVVPHGGGDVAPAGVVVQVDVEGGVAQVVCCVAQCGAFGVGVGTSLGSIPVGGRIVR